MRNIGSIIDGLRSGAGAPTRHENPYLQEALHYAHSLFTAQEIKGKYATLFSQPQDLIIEVGSYQGKTLTELAQSNPHYNFLGLDITYKRVVKTARKIENMSLKNAAVSIARAEDIFANIVPKNSLAGVCIFFPDPWLKARQEKNRLLQEDFIRNVFSCLKPGGFFWFKTDQQNYFLETRELSLKSGFEILATEDSEKKPSHLLGGPYETIFQKIFITKQLPFYAETFIKK